MVEIANFYGRVRQVVDGLRREGSVTGLWQKPQAGIDEDVSELIIVEREGQKVEKLVLGGNGSDMRTEGRLVARRLKGGHPIRGIFFISDDGKEEVLLESHEF